jgi:hypothetical protein
MIDGINALVACRYAFSKVVKYQCGVHRLKILAALTPNRDDAYGPADPRVLDPLVDREVDIDRVRAGLRPAA